jgi:hypothetical protein
MTLPDSPLRLAGQFTILAAVAAFAAAFSAWPAYRQIPADAAVIKLSFNHRAERECRRRTPEELAKLPPNMRRPMECPRGRPDIFAELVIDGATVFSQPLPPSGLARDGPSQIYRRFVVAAGEHAIVARMRDTARNTGFDHELVTTIRLIPGQSIALDFRPEHGGFVLR